jgi:biopolymer transport protein TolR
MKYSRRTKRMKMHHARSKDRTASLNMISLMDIFTILVFFLLVNATSSEVLPTPRNITLPSASSEQLPRKNLVIVINNSEITLQGARVAWVDKVLNEERQTIESLFLALKAKAGKVEDITDTQGVTIMADKTVPYDLVKKVMLTARGANFTNISFAVNQKAVKAES